MKPRPILHTVARIGSVLGLLLAVLVLLSAQPAQRASAQDAAGAQPDAAPVSDPAQADTPLPTEAVQPAAPLPVAPDRSGTSATTPDSTGEDSDETLPERRQPVVTPTTEPPPIEGDLIDPADEAAPRQPVAPMPMTLVSPEARTDALVETFDEGTGVNWLLDGWSVVNDASGNPYLEATYAGASADLTRFYLGNFDLSARVQIAPDSTLSFVLTDMDIDQRYAVMLDARGNSRLYFNDDLVAANTNTPATDGLDAPTAAQVSWQRIALTVRGTALSVGVDGRAFVSYELPTTIAEGQLSLLTGATNLSPVRVDDVQVYPRPDALTREPEIVETSETPNTERAFVVPEQAPVSRALPDGATAPVATVTRYDDLTPEQQAKLPPRIAARLDLGLDATNALAADAPSVLTDDAGRYAVTIWAQVNLRDQIQALGGVVTASTPYSLEAYLPLESFIPLAANNAVSGFELPRLAASIETDANSALAGYASLDAPAAPPNTGNFTSAFDIMGAENWHQAGLRGNGVRVGIIATGFNTSGTDTGATDFRCVNSFAPVTGNAGTAATGLHVAEVICDIAPDSTIFFYQAQTYTQVSNAIAAARAAGAPATAMDVLVIALDLGASATPGDGEGVGGNDPYAQLSLARAEGMVILALAGDNEQMDDDLGATYTHRYTAFEYSGGNVTIPILARPGEFVNVAWSANDWNNPADRPTVTLTDQSLNLPNPTSGNAGDQFDTSGCTVDDRAFCTLDLNFTGFQAGTGPVIVQVQVTGDGGLGRPGNHIANAGSLARPADSPDVLAVGAICSSDRNNFPRVPHSSIGPIYGPNGATPTASAPYTRSTTKPDVMGYAHVRVSTPPLNNVSPNLCDGTVLGSAQALGFQGTAAAVGHVAGVAALLQSSNLSTVNPNMISLTDGSAAAVDLIEDYIQSRTADLPLGGGADGLDRLHGAGMSVLGSPFFDLTATQQVYTGLADDNIAACSNVWYVGQGNLNAARDGVYGTTPDNPFMWPAEALAAASAGDCIVALPGEYATPLYINGIADNLSLLGYNFATQAPYPVSRFNVQAQYWGTGSDLGNPTPGDYRYPPRANPDDPDPPRYSFTGGLFVDNTDNFTISGFSYLPGDVFSGGTRDPQAVLIFNSENVTVSDGSLGQVTLDGRAYSGFVGDASPIVILDESHGARVENMSFIGNAVQNEARTPSVTVVNSGTNAQRTVIIGNDIRNNNHASSGSVTEWGAILLTVDSAVDIVNNAFVGNDTETVVNHQTAAADSPQDVRHIGNVYLNNTTRTEEDGSNAGSLVSLYFVPNFYFLSNTVVNNDIASVGPSAIISRGDPEGARAITAANNQRWDIHNNLFYNNTILEGIVSDSRLDDDETLIVQCNDLAGNPDAGMQHNWVFGNIISTIPEGGYCAASLANAANDNIVDDSNNGTQFDNPAPQFVGAAQGGLNPDEDIIFYALAEIAEDVFSSGIDAADATLGGGVAGIASLASVNPELDAGQAGATYDTTISGSSRINDIDLTLVGQRFENSTIPDGTGDGAMDIGAFEYREFQILEDPIARTIAEDSGVFTFDLNTIADGIGRLTFAAATPPTNWGTHCGPEFTDDNQGLVINNGFVRYCPPQDFYTDDFATSGRADDPNWPDTINFTYSVIDETGAQANGTFSLVITPVADDPLTAVIGDNNPEGDIFQSPTGLAGVIVVPMRPNVRFNNFTFSERDNAEFVSETTNQTDYPYTYDNLQINDPSGLIADAIIQGGELRVTPVERRTGTAQVTYDVTDANGATQTQVFTVAVETIAAEVAGLFDDSSFAFQYADASGDSGTGNWQPTQNALTINGTLHTTNGAGDTARFTFNGTGFVLYLYSERLGGTYELRVNGEAATTDWTPIEPGSDFVENQIGDVTCTTRADTNGIFISNRSNRSETYTVTCDGILKGSYPVEIINQVGTPEAVQVLHIDAFSVIDDNATNAPGPFAPGFYDVDQAEVRAIFDDAPNEWQDDAFSSYDNGIAFATTRTGNLTDLAFSIVGGTGFAIGTQLDRTDATYTICVTRSGTLNSTCQNYDNAPEGSRTRRTYQAYRTFYGLSPSSEYIVTIENISVPGGGAFIFDSITVFPPTDDTATMPFASIEDDALAYFVYGGVTPDSWQLNGSFGTASNSSLTQMNPRVTQVGPFVAFEVPATANSFEVTQNYSARDTDQMLVCVDRGLGMLDGNPVGDYGNCLQVNVPNGTARRINGTNGSLTGNIDLGRIDGVLTFNEADFPNLWGDLNRNGTVGDSLVEDAERPHVVEIFNLSSTAGFNIDKVTISGTEQPYSPGTYEESVAGLVPFNSSLNVVTKTSAPFSYDTNRSAGRDSGQGVLITSQNNSGVAFNIKGNGFAPLFRLDANSGRVQICWLGYDDSVPNNTPTINTVIGTGNCETFDNNSRATQYTVPRPILGLEAGAYAVVVQNQQNRPMVIDGFRVYDADWQTSLQQMTPGRRYEADYDARVEDRLFLYFGDNWSHVAGAEGNRRSENNYDVNLRGTGATMLFRMNDADAVTIYRDLRSNLSAYDVCYAPEATPADKTCVTIDNTGNGFIQPITIPLNDTGTTEPYVVTITSADFEQMIIDAIEPTVLAQTLTIGTYDDNHPGIFYPDLSLWRSENQTQFFGGSYSRSTSNGAIAYFTFQGTGFNLGMTQDTNGGEVEVCYTPGTTVPDANDTCIIYVHEVRGSNFDTQRPVVGLPDGIYTVRIRDVNNGISELGLRQRSGFGAIGLDFVQIFDEPLPPTITTALDVNEDHVIDGERMLQLLPGQNWLEVADNSASAFSAGSYVTLADNQGNESRTVNGPVGVLTLDLDGPADGTDYQEATVIIKSDAGSRVKSDQLLACVDNVDGEVDYNNGNPRLVNSNSCTLTRDLLTDSQIVFNRQNLPLLGQPTGVDGDDRVFSFRTLSGGILRVDGIQVLYGRVLTDGFYEESIGYGTGSQILRVNNAGQWSVVSARGYSGGAALETDSNNASLTFDFEGTGFSLLSYYDRFGGVFNGTITNAGGTFNEIFTINTNSNLTQSEAAFTYASLPFDTYTVTLTAQLGGGQRNVVDGIRVYGALNALGSLYDDAETTLNGDPLLTYGPTRTTWTPILGGAARNALNQTVHQTTNGGATVTFEIGATTPATGIVLIYGATTRSRAVDVCFGDPTTAVVPDCVTLDPSAERSGRLPVALPNGLPAGNYHVSIINQDFNLLQLDAIQVLEGDTLAEGIYDSAYLDDVVGNVFDANWTIDTRSNRAIGSAGAVMTFDMTGIGFSILLNENGRSAERYRVCVTNEGSGTPCDVIDENPQRADRPLGQFSLNYLGLHGAGNTNANYTVTLTNTGTNNLEVDAVHVYGARPNLLIQTKEIVENNDPRIRYLPFGGMAEEVDRLGQPSGSSQQTTSQRGAGAYFEFVGAGGFEYVRQTARNFGNVRVCYGVIGTDTTETATCANNVANDSANAYQVGRTFVTGNTCTTDGCWVSIENQSDNSIVTFDYTRRFDTNDPLAAGNYEDNFPALNFVGTWARNVEEARASGGFVAETTSTAATLDFLMNGSAFSVNLTQDRDAGQVDLCWLPYTDAIPTIATVQNTGECQRFDNNNQRATYNAPRTIAGLVPGNYRVVVDLVGGGNLEVDSVSVYDEAWFAADATDWVNGTGLRALEPGRKYETSFDNRAAENLFLYYGDWVSNTGAKARSQSGNNFDATRETGATVVFRTAGANAMQIFRDVRKGYSPILVCAQQLDIDPLTAAAPRTCQQLSSDGVGFGEPISFQFGDEDTNEYIVSISTLTPDIFNLDAFEVFNVTQPMTAGTYEDVSPQINYDGVWEASYNSRAYTAGRLLQSTNDDASFQFEFTGTGFELGLIAGVEGGEAEMCYGPSATFDADKQCFTYQQEASDLQSDVSRTVVGLPNNTYTVTVTDVEDGFTVLRRNDANFPRNARYPVGKLMLDYVTIFDSARPPVLPAGYYNDNASTDTGALYLQTLPANKWSRFTGSVAARYTEASYLTVVDDFNRAGRLAAGPAALLTVDVPTDADITLVLYNTSVSRANTDQLLICAGDGMSGEITWNGSNFRLTQIGGQRDCTLENAMQDSSQVVVTSADLTALGNPGEQRIMITALSTGFLYLDAYQIIEGNALAPGIHDTFLPDTLLDFNVNNAGSLDRSAGRCTSEDRWCTQKSSRSIGGDYVYTSAGNASLGFNIVGTGFSVLTNVDAVGVDFRICYKRSANPTPFSQVAGNQTDPGQVDLSANDVSGIWCDLRTTNTNTRGGADWDELNPNRPIIRGTGLGYGFSYYGLPSDAYSVEVRVADNAISARDRLQIDAIAVFGGTNSVLTPGFYDNVDPRISYEPATLWTNGTDRVGPPRGAYNLTEHTTINGGTIAQMTIEGNAFTLFHGVNTRNSNWVSVCVQITGEVAHCTPANEVNVDPAGSPTNNTHEVTEFSMFGRTASFVPVMFYGLGDGEHSITMENRDTLEMNVDAIQVHE